MRGDGFFEKTLFFLFEYLRMEGKGKRRGRMIVSGYVFWGDFLAFCFYCLLLLLLLMLMLMFVLFLWRGN